MLNRVIPSLILGCLCCALYGCSSPAPDNAKTGNSSSAPAAQPAPGTATNATAVPLPPTGYKVEWLSHQIPSEMQAGKEQMVTVTFKNAGIATWPSKGADGTAKNQVFVAYHWLPAQGETPVMSEGQRTTLPRDIGPGETVTLNNVLVVAPKQADSYRLQVTLVQEMVAWFDMQGAKTLVVPVKVQ